MHIGIHCREYPPSKHGGIGSFSKDLADGLVSAGHQVTVFGFYDDYVLSLDGPIYENINGVRVVRLPRRVSTNRVDHYLNRASELWRLRSLVTYLHQAESIDVIESPEESGWFAFGCPSDIPLITRLHGGTKFFARELGRRSSRLDAILERMQMKRSESLIGVSRYVLHKTLYHHQLSLDGRVIYNGVRPLNVEKGCVIDILDNYIVYAGSIIPKKGVETLIRAFPLVLKSHPEVKLILAGKDSMPWDGYASYKDYLIGLLPEFARNQVFFLGSIDREKELLPILAQGMIACYPSHMEAFAIAPMEAMALGKAVIYTAHSSGPELITHGKDGLLCNTKSSDELANCIIYLLDNPDLREKLGKSAKEKIGADFSLDKMIVKTLDAYSCLVKTKTRKGIN